MDSSIPERMAVVETKVDALILKVDHIDLCVDSIKRTIWKATGIITAILFLLQFFAKH